MSSEQQLEAVEVSIEQAEEQVKKHEALSRLEQNKDFKYLVVEQLLKEDAIRQVHLKASPMLMGAGAGPEAARAGIDARMTMIGEFANWCRYIHQEGLSAKAALDEHRNAREEILAEQLEE